MGLPAMELDTVFPCFLLASSILKDQFKQDCTLYAEKIPRATPLTIHKNKHKIDQRPKYLA